MANEDWKTTQKTAEKGKETQEIRREREKSDRWFEGFIYIYTIVYIYACIYDIYHNKH